MYTEIKIRILKKDERGYPVEINSQGQVFEGYLDSAVLPWVGTASPIEDGARLFAHLFADDTPKKAWSQICGQAPERRVRLRIDVDAPELHAIPWEQLQDGTTEPPQIIAADEATPFSRDLAVSHPFGEPLTNRPIKMLVMIATPENLPDYKLQPLDWETERAVIDSIWLQSPNPAELQITTLNEPATLSALETALGDGYQLLHIVAHGKKGEHSNKSVLYLANEDNQVDFVSVSDLTTMLGRQTNLPRFIFLVACQTATRSPADAFRGFAPQLIQTGIPAVLAMQDLVPVKTARQFTQTFYQHLFRHGLVDLAANKARSILMTKGLPGSAIPVLFSRLSENQLIGGKLPLIQKFELELEPDGGTMSSDSPFYIEREADKLCWQTLNSSRQGKTIVLKAPWQTGKSSLMVRMQDRIEEALERHVAFVDFQDAFNEPLNLTDLTIFLKTFCRAIGEELNLPDKVDDYWDSRQNASKNCSRYLANYIVSQLDKPLVLMLDEVGLVSDRDFKLQFYRMLRVWHNNRARKAKFRQVSLVLSISTETHRLIDQGHESPFNVGQSVVLSGFNETEAHQLNRVYQTVLSDDQVNRLHQLLQGHPLLMRMAFDHLFRGMTLDRLLEQAIEDDGPFAEALQRYRRIIQGEPILKDALQQISHTQRLDENDSFYRLQELGLIKRAGKKVLFRNQLYAQYFEERL
ncbi:AAA-like domain-containing protein [Anaerolineales bacterium HSG6]|nr:AAA-like domain-containing protein [Anaerolineales bacterium HSG6]